LPSFDAKALIHYTILHSQEGKCQHQQLPDSQ
jgi:hypothetical protein